MSVGSAVPGGVLGGVISAADSGRYTADGNDPQSVGSAVPGGVLGSVISAADSGRYTADGNDP